MKIDKKEYLQSFIDSIRDEKNEIEKEIIRKQNRITQLEKKENELKKEYKKIILEENKNLIKRYKKEVWKNEGFQIFINVCFWVCILLFLNCL